MTSFYKDNAMQTPALRSMILEAGFSKFRQFGIRRVTMDEIARELRISKKTLYRYFPDKAAMVQACADRVTGEVLPLVQRALANSGSVAERFSSILEAFSRVPRFISPSFIADLRVDYPQVWESIDARRRGVIAHFERLIEDGIASGEVHAEIHPKVFMRVILAVLERVLVPEVMLAGEFTPAQAIETVAVMLTQGVLVKAPARLGRQRARPMHLRKASRPSRVKETGR
jgi:AcrR family transcriptional regulator